MTTQDSEQMTRQESRVGRVQNYLMIEKNTFLEFRDSLDLDQGSQRTGYRKARTCPDIEAEPEPEFQERIQRQASLPIQSPEMRTMSSVSTDPGEWTRRLSNFSEWSRGSFVIDEADTYSGSVEFGEPFKATSSLTRSNRLSRFLRDTAPEMRTTVMIRNIPCRCTQDQLMEEVSKVSSEFNFLYLPSSRKRDGTLGYAFVNFVAPEEAARFIQDFGGHVFPRQPNSTKRAQCSYAILQGFKENVRFYRRSKVAKGEYRPYISKSSNLTRKTTSNNV